MTFLVVFKRETEASQIPSKAKNNMKMKNIINKETVMSKEGFLKNTGIFQSNVIFVLVDLTKISL